MEIRSPTSKCNSFDFDASFPELFLTSLRSIRTREDDYRPLIEAADELSVQRQPQMGVHHRSK
jgi:hypothetical protein